MLFFNSNSEYYNNNNNNNNNNNDNNICTLNTQNLSPPLSLSVSSDDFFVDQLLNFNDDDQQGEDESFVVSETPDANKVSLFHSTSVDFDPTRLDFGSVLSVPAEEADLEWLSHFVEESFSQFSSPYPDATGPNIKPESEPENPKVASFSSPHAVNKSRRSKRARTGGRVWTTALSESSSASTTSSSSGPTRPNPDPARRQKKKEFGPGSPRRCTHCGVQKTPQWRCGPLGPKSLCNACGVRYKSGRLLPEYRPACSPTFSSELHSNSHRKVLEMRRKKEGEISGRVRPGLSHPVPSFG